MVIFFKYLFIKLNSGETYLITKLRNLFIFDQIARKRPSRRQNEKNKD